MLSNTIYILSLLCGCHGISEYFVTSSCNTTIGQTYGDVLRFDADSDQDAWVIPSSTLDCWITFQGYVAEADTPQRYATLQWREGDHYLAGYGWHSASSGCDTAYVEVYNVSDIGLIDSPPLMGPVCGTELPAEVTTISSMLVLHIYVEAPPPGTYNSSLVANEDKFTALPSCVNNTSNVTDGNETTCMTEYGPFINFTVDFTSYFIGSCSDDNIDDATQFECDPGTNRCIASGLRCDVYYSNNCGDSGDVIAGPPGNCTIDYTTTEAPHTEDPYDLLPLWITLGLLAGLMAAYWCCWRPGWLPWRLARLRNVRCCQSLSKCCNRASPCCQGRDGGGGPCSAACCIPCRKCTRCCTKTGSGYPHSHAQYNLQQQSKGSNGYTNGGGEGNSMGSVPPNWMKFANDDGAHIREMR